MFDYTIRDYVKNWINDKISKMFCKYNMLIDDDCIVDIINWCDNNLENKYFIVYVKTNVKIWKLQHRFGILNLNKKNEYKPEIRFINKNDCLKFKLIWK